MAQQGKKSNTEEFKKRSIEIHNDKYNYDLVDYKGSNIDVIIICPEHGNFGNWFGYDNTRFFNNW